MWMWIEIGRHLVKFMHPELVSIRNGKVGGFLPFLAPFIPAIAAALKAATLGAVGAAGAYGAEKLLGKGKKRLCNINIYLLISKFVLSSSGLAAFAFVPLAALSLSASVVDMIERQLKLNERKEEYKMAMKFYKEKKSLEEIYYNPETGYRRINDLVRKTGYSQKEVSEFLHKQDVYTLHRPNKKKFETRRVYAPYNYQWVSDLAFMQKYKGFKYILTIIDAFTEYAWAIPIRNKTGDEITNAFGEIFKERKPERMQTVMSLYLNY
ncbi:hypothetical protein LAZ67_12001945 [Cordylochernes scorpioides]|uniref:Integrase catalytic domain-containing protein n=1 Tax=Cordylochernes scorpioides TaxID=51811 RepID=A0ABY6L5E6_9ARAC|nr:hypothetical protein LAZ67_12001945 [Cordylochernes scorpioides]